MTQESRIQADADRKAVWIGLYRFDVAREQRPAFLHGPRGDQRLDRLELGRDLRAELAQRREARGIGHGPKFGFDLSPLLGQLVGIPVQAQRLGRLGLHRGEMVAEACELLIEVGELSAKLAAGIVVVTVQPAEFGFDVLVQLVIVAEPPQVIANQSEDMRLNQVGGDSVPLRALVLVALLVA